jgi:hypothetical protein
MILDEESAPVTQLSAQIRGKVLPELGAVDARAVRHARKDARARGLERAGVHVLVLHFL